MGGMLYEPEGRIECASHDQTYLVHWQSRGYGLTKTVRSLCSAEISSSEKSVSMVTCTNLAFKLPVPSVVLYS